MADNVQLSTNVGTGDVAAADDVGGVKFQRVKVTWGVDGTCSDVNNTTPLPIADGGGSLTVDGTIAASNLPATVDTNSGNKSASTLRVVLATDQPALTNKLLTTPDLPSGASTAAKQPALGTAGVASTDVITVQGIASMTKLLVTPDSVALPANQSVNVAQINGVATTMGNGVSGTGVQRVTIANDSTGVLATVSTVSTVTTLSTLTGGGVAHDGADSGNPVKVGAKAITSLKTTTLVASADRTDLQSDLDGAAIVRGQFPLGDLLSERVSDTGGSSTAFSNFSAVASTKNYITAITVFRTDAGTTPAYVDFRDGTAGSILWSQPLPPNGGSVLPAGAVPYFKTSANTALAYDVSAALTTVLISVSGFQSKV